MLPLDEEPFEIDANKRTISVPSVFKSGVSVKGDIAAETLIFRIDRYFDAMDLNSCDIFVQWQRGNDESHQWVTPIEDLIDIQSEPGKIIFGWPLSGKVTEEAGQIKFSVRFVKDNGATYSFSTLIQTININTGLNYDIDNTQADSVASDLFDSIITNSETSVGVPAAKPILDKNLDPAINYYIDDTSLTNTLAVHANVADSGIVTYDWFYSDVEDSVGQKIEDASSTPEADKDGAYTVSAVDGNNVVGYYWAKAVNKISGKQKSTKSKKAYFPGANEPVFASQPQNAILGDSPLLEVAMAADEHMEHNKVTYAWEMKATSDATSYAAVADATANMLVPETAGIYRVKVTNTVNANSLTNTSADCTVYDAPGAVVFANTEDTILIKDNTYELAVTLPGEFATGTVKYTWWVNYDSEAGILVDGKLPGADAADKKIEYLVDQDNAKIEITTDLLAYGAYTLHCVASNTITLGDKTYVTYSESQAYKVSAN